MSKTIKLFDISNFSLILLIFLVFSGVSYGQQEDFTIFRKRFFTDEKFQVERIKFPLKIRDNSSSSESGFNDSWNLTRWRGEYNTWRTYYKGPGKLIKKLAEKSYRTERKNEILTLYV